VKKNEKGYYRRSLHITQNDGTKKRVTVYGKTKKEVDEKYHKTKSDYNAGKLVFNSNTTFGEWVDEWLDVYKKSKVTSSTFKEINGIMQRVYLDNISTTKLCDLKLLHLQKCLNGLEGKSKSYIHRAYIYAKATLEKACENDLITKNPCRGLEEPTASEQIERRPLSDTERKYFMEAMQTHHRGDFFGILLACGLRPAEARALTWFNVDMTKHTVTITQSMQDNCNIVKAPKTAAGKRTVPVPSWYMEILKTVKRTDSPYVFPNAKGKPMDAQRYLKSWHSLLRMMDIAAGAKLYRNKIIVHVLAQDLTPYSLRHTYATDLAEKGVDLKTAQYLLGHNDIRVTANIYTHITQKMIDTARELINQ